MAENMHRLHGKFACERDPGVLFAVGHGAGAGVGDGAG